MTRRGVWMVAVLAAGAVWTLWRFPYGGVADAGRNFAGVWPAGPWLAGNAARAVAAVALAGGLLFIYDTAGRGLLRWLSRVRHQMCLSSTL